MPLINVSNLFEIFLEICNFKFFVRMFPLDVMAMQTQYLNISKVPHLIKDGYKTFIKYLFSFRSPIKRLTFLSNSIFCHECLFAYVIGAVLIGIAFIYRKIELNRSNYFQNLFFRNSQPRHSNAARSPRKRRPGSKFREKEIRIAIINRLKKADPDLFKKMNVRLEFGKNGEIFCVPKVVSNSQKMKV